MAVDPWLDTKKINVLVGKAFDEHVRKEHIKVDSRLQFLEDRSGDVDQMNGRLLSLEVGFRDTSSKVGMMSKELTTFTEKADERADAFERNVLSANNSFIRWLIGIVVSSLIFGLFFQYKAFQEVHDSINNLEKKVIIFKHNNTRKQP